MNDDFTLNWYGIDFDDTLVHNTGYPYFTPTEPIKGAREAMLKFHEMGKKVVIYTARGWADHKMIKHYLIDHDIYFDDIICGKPLFEKVYDDRNEPFDGNWKKVLKKIK